MRRGKGSSFRGAPVTLFSLGFLAGAAWRGRRPAVERAPGRMPAPRPSRRPAEPYEPPHPGGERASVLGYERAPAPAPEPEAPSGAPGHRILSG